MVIFLAGGSCILYYSLDLLTLVLLYVEESSKWCYLVVLVVVHCHDIFWFSDNVTWLKLW